MDVRFDADRRRFLKRAWHDEGGRRSRLAGRSSAAILLERAAREEAVMPAVPSVPEAAGVRKLLKPGAPSRQFNKLRQVFPQSHFERLLDEDFDFYHTTFWYPLDRRPENIFESIVSSLRAPANPSSSVIGVEWWFSVLLTNATPQWLLPCHFDRNDLAEEDLRKLKHPDIASVLFLNAVPYGELVVTDQVLTEEGARPKQPKDMLFIRPSRNLYAVFPGHLYHGVIGRMWRPIRRTKLRITMAVNWWTERPKATYLHDSRECISVFRLGA